MTAEGAKSDGWICSASDSPLAATQKQLKKYNANRRLRKAAMGIIMQKRVEKDQNKAMECRGGDVTECQCFLIRMQRNTVTRTIVW